LGKCSREKSPLDNQKEKVVERNERSFRSEDARVEKGAKRVAIMNAALELVAEHGFHGAPMAMVAERAGVGSGTIYRYFESKDVLIIATFADLEQRLVSAVMHDYPEGEPVRERFLHMARILVGHCVSSPMEFRFLEQFHNSPFGSAHRREKLFGKQDKDICTELFEEAREKRVVKDLPLAVLFSLAFAPLLGICRDQILGFITMDDGLLGQSVEACWDAVKR
jgi:AcrR family transcriptional regulator